ncbi:MAG: NAD(P)-binding domain-containing protein, partial [Acidimicrobiia bacterium]
MNTSLDRLLQSIESRDAVIGVMGLGYVGLPVCVAFADAGFSVVGVDIDTDRIEAINAGDSYLEDVAPELISAVRASGRLAVSDSAENLREVDAVLICVPT